MASGLPVNDDGVLRSLNVGVQGAEYGIIFEKMGQGFSVHHVVGGHDVDIRIFIRGTENVPSYPSESIYAYFCCH
jgi:hypothetical protein